MESSRVSEGHRPTDDRQPLSSMFDPYHKWLGIRDIQRPPNHYRLLGVELFETDTDVIQAAADRQMSHIRQYQSGEKADVSQRILNEIAQAKVCLLTPDRRVAYDKRLKADLARALPSPPVTAQQKRPVASNVACDSGYQRCTDERHGTRQATFFPAGLSWRCGVARGRCWSICHSAVEIRRYGQHR